MLLDWAKSRGYFQTFSEMRFRDLALNSGRPRASVETSVSIMAMAFGALLHWLRDFLGGAPLMFV